MRCLIPCNQKAFTLIEMLISILLLSLIVATMMFGFKQSINELQRSKFIAPQKVIEFSQLRSLIKGMFPYVIEIQRNFEDKKLEVYIYPKTDSLEFISKNPIYSHEISIAKLECREDKLIYYEKPLYSPTSNYLAPSLNEEDRKKSFFENLEECNFSYEWGTIGNNPTLITLQFKPLNKASKEYRFAPMVDFNNTRLITIVNDREF
ncbi:MAG: prepilin-type N-terminal cleavage/methylation domain-containing protein [Campylobacterales bacterium]|nr:prepilin-type N-terminal cleavage/methylation domain-containing protein [Campylobacterales bacterium]